MGTIVTSDKQYGDKSDYVVVMLSDPTPMVWLMDRIFEIGSCVVEPQKIGRRFNKLLAKQGEENIDWLAFWKEIIQEMKTGLEGKLEEEKGRW